MDTFWELFSPLMRLHSAVGEGVGLRAARGVSMQLGAHIACARFIIEQTLAVCNFCTNLMFSQIFCRAVWMENLYNISKYFLPAAIPFNKAITRCQW